VICGTHVFRPVRGTLSIVPQESAHALTQPALCRQSPALFRQPNVRRNAGKTDAPWQIAGAAPVAFAATMP
jgi:hypothetical protein